MNKTSSQTLVKTNLLEIDITTSSEKQILEYVIGIIERTKEKIQIVTPNPEMIVYSHKHLSFKTLLNQAQISLPDGVGILLAGLFLGKPFNQRITGVDFMDLLCEESVKRGWTVGLLGAKPGVAQKAADCLIKKHPGVKIPFAVSEWEENEKKKTCDILFVAFGFPKQEKWIAEHLPDLPVRLAMGVGGAFDYISGTIERAPFIVRSVGFEWLYRLIRQPWRIKRQLALVEFVFMVLRSMISK